MVLVVGLPSLIAPHFGELLVELSSWQVSVLVQPENHHG